MKTLFLTLAIFLVGAGASTAQKGTAEPGYYPMGYHGDTWTGLVTSANDDTREFTLSYKKGDKEETFVGVLPKVYIVKMKSGRDHEVKTTELIGMRLKAYYTANTKKVNDQKVKINEVFQIKFLAQGK